MLSLRTRLRRKDDDIVAKVMDGEAVIINLSTGIYYSIDHVGAAMWELVEHGSSLDEIAAAIVARYDVSPAQAQADVARLGDELLHHDLVAVAADERPESASSVPIAAAASKLPYTAPQLQVYTDMEDLLALDPPTPGFADIPWKQ